MARGGARVKPRLGPVGDVTLHSDDTNVALALEYVIAAEELAAHAGPLGEWVGRPVCYLLRHAVEIALKHALTWAEIEVHRNEPGYTPFSSPDRIEHGLLDLASELDDLLAKTGNPVLPARTRALLASINALDPDGQRFRYVRYGGKRAKGKSIPPGTRVNLSRLATRTRTAVDYLLHLSPGRRREMQERRERQRVLMRTQSLPVIAPPGDFGQRRSSDGSCVLPMALLPAGRIGQMVRVGTPDDYEITWLVESVEGGDFVVSAVPRSGRIPVGRRLKLAKAGQCPGCGHKPVQPLDDGRAIRLIAFDSCEVLPKKPVMFVPNRVCPECRLRYFVPKRPLGRQADKSVAAGRRASSTR
jgi:hypothetical protein